MLSVDSDWETFLESGPTQNSHTNIEKNDTFIPKCSDIYISTQTKIAFLNQNINLSDLFWKIPVTPYHTPTECVIKKQMKVNSTTEEEVDMVEKLTRDTPGIVIIDTIAKINNPNARKVKFKDVRKINIGLCKKDLVSYRTKKKGAFYNCFVLILRIKNKHAFKEAHVKVFNTGKLEIPGIQDTLFLYKVLDKLVSIM